MRPSSRGELINWALNGHLQPLYTPRIAPRAIAAGLALSERANHIMLLLWMLRMSEGPQNEGQSTLPNSNAAQVTQGNCRGRNLVLAWHRIKG
jgi:hypothetical protein